MKISLFTIYFLIVCKLVFGQQVSQYSQWSSNQFSINPALAGIKNCLDMRSMARAQWAGFEGAPISGLLTVNAPINSNPKSINSPFHGIGGKVEADQFGQFNNFALSLAYAIHFPLDNNNKRLSFGVNAGFQQYGFDHTSVVTINPDPSVSSSANMLLTPLIGAGAWYHTKTWYAGFSIDQLARNRWSDIGFASRFRIHSYLTTGTKLPINEMFTLQPQVLFRIPPAGPISADLNLMLDYNNLLKFGLGYRNTDALIAFFRINLNQFSVGYSFDYITSAIQGGHWNTHEISLFFNTCDNKKRAINACPLFD